MLVLVRHGQTAANRGGLLQGRVDLPLTELGAVQAQAAAEHLRDLGRDRPGGVRVVSSPLLRARATAETIAKVLGTIPEIDDRLVEVDYGAWDERPLADVPAETWAQWRSDPHFAPPDGESLHAVGERATALAGELLAADDVTIAVSHVSPIKAIVAWALGCDTAVTWRMHLDVASVSRVAMRAGRPVLTAFNEIPRLG